jgi:hypothetical protein
VPNVLEEKESGEVNSMKIKALVPVARTTSKLSRYCW